MRTLDELKSSYFEAGAALEAGVWDALQELLSDEFPDAVRFTTLGEYGTEGLDITIDGVFDKDGVDLLAARDARGEAADCEWCTEAESAEYKAGLGHDAECPLASERNERVAGEWGSGDLNEQAGELLMWLAGISPGDYENEQEHDLTRPWQLVKLVAVLRLRRTYNDALDLDKLLPVTNDFGEVMFAATSPGYDGEFAELGADPSSWKSV